MGVITKPSSVQRSVIVWLLVSCGMEVGYGGARPPAVASRGSIPQTGPPAQGAAHAAADPDSAQKPPVLRIGLSAGTIRVWHDPRPGGTRSTQRPTVARLAPAPVGSPMANTVRLGP